MHNNATESNIMISTEKLETIISQLEEKEREVEDTLKNINDKMKHIDGTSDTWKGVVQDSLYNRYSLTQNEFPKIIEQLTNYNKYLRTTVENYKKGEQTIKKSLKNNSDDLDIN